MKNIKELKGINLQNKIKMIVREIMEEEEKKEEEKK